MVELSARLGFLRWSLVLAGQRRWACSCGVHVAALEKDPKHFQVLTLRLTAEASSPVNVLRRAADRGETCELFRVLAADCTRLMRDRHSHFVQTAEEDAEDDSAAWSSSSSSAAPVAERKCPVRGQALASKPEAVLSTVHAGR